MNQSQRKFVARGDRLGMRSASRGLRILPDRSYRQILGSVSFLALPEVTKRSRLRKKPVQRFLILKLSVPRPSFSKANRPGSYHDEFQNLGSANLVSHGQIAQLQTSSAIVSSKANSA